MDGTFRLASFGDLIVEWLILSTTKLRTRTPEARVYKKIHREEFCQGFLCNGEN